MEDRTGHSGLVDTQTVLLLLAIFPLCCCCCCEALPVGHPELARKIRAPPLQLHCTVLLLQRAREDRRRHAAALCDRKPENVRERASAADYKTQKRALRQQRRGQFTSAAAVMMPFISCRRASSSCGIS